LIALQQAYSYRLVFTYIKKNIFRRRSNFSGVSGGIFHRRSTTLYKSSKI